jgi:hypothetical protein
VVTYTLNRQPVHRLRYDGASEAAKVSCEMFERLLELDTLKHDSAANLVRRLATLADLSPSAFRLVLRAGSGDTGSILASFEDQARDRGKTRQALHWEWQEDVRRIRMVFPEVAGVLVELRETIKHREDAMSSADGLREAMRQTEGDE